MANWTALILDGWLRLFKGSKAPVTISCVLPESLVSTTRTLPVFENCIIRSWSVFVALINVNEL